MLARSNQSEINWLNLMTNYGHIVNIRLPWRQTDRTVGTG